MGSDFSAIRSRGTLYPGNPDVPAKTNLSQCLDRGGMGMFRPIQHGFSLKTVCNSTVSIPSGPATANPALPYATLRGNQCRGMAAFFSGFPQQIAVLPYHRLDGNRYRHNRRFFCHCLLLRKNAKRQLKCTCRTHSKLSLIHIFRNFQHFIIVIFFDFGPDFYIPSP